MLVVFVLVCCRCLLVLVLGLLIGCFSGSDSLCIV